MPTYSSEQKLEVISKITEIKEKLDILATDLFNYSTDVSKMYYADLTKGIFALSNPDTSLKIFKPENSLMKDDYVFWRNFLEFEVEIEISKNNIEQNKYQEITNQLSKFVGWIKSVKTLLKSKIPCYQNVLSSYTTSNNNIQGTDANVGIGVITNAAKFLLEPTETIQYTSVLAKIKTGIFGYSPVYFSTEALNSIPTSIENKTKEIISILNNPTPVSNNPITPVQFDSTGSRKLIQTILDLQQNITILFKAIAELIEKNTNSINFVYEYLTTYTRYDLTIIITYLQLLLGGDPSEIGVTSTNEIKYFWLIGSDGSYYPVPPIESTDTDNDVYLSRTNGILAGLKRADENARWRYRRLNDSLFEVATNNNINKAYLDDLSPRILAVETKVTEIQTKQLELEVKINEMGLKIDEILSKVNTL